MSIHRRWIFIFVYGFVWDCIFYLGNLSDASSSWEKHFTRLTREALYAIQRRFFQTRCCMKRPKLYVGFRCHCQGFNGDAPSFNSYKIQKSLSRISSLRVISIVCVTFDNYVSTFSTPTNLAPDVRPNPHFFLLRLLPAIAPQQTLLVDQGSNQLKIVKNRLCLCSCQTESTMFVPNKLSLPSDVFFCCIRQFFFMNLIN